MGKNLKSLPTTSNTVYNLRYFVVVILLFGMTVSLMAQEATAEPAVTEAAASQPTAAPTETPFSTEVPPSSTETPMPEVTQPIDPTSDPEAIAPEATSELPTVEPTNEPVLIITPQAPQLMLESFDAFTAIHWALSGWEAASDERGGYLTTATTGSAAYYLDFIHSDLTLVADVEVSLGSTLSIYVNNYHILFDSFGNNRIYLLDQLLAASEVSVPDGSEPTLYQLSITLQGGVFTVTVGDNTYHYQTVDAPIASPVTFIATLAEGGTVSLHNLILQELEVIPPAVIIVPTETPITSETEAAPEYTPESSLPEATESPEATDDAPELTVEAPEATSEPDLVVFAPAAAPFLTSDFETELVGWITTGSIVAENDTNHVLLLAGDGNLSPAVAAAFSEVEASARLRWLQADSSFALSLGSIQLVLSPTEISITTSETVTAPVSLAADTWHDVQFAVRADAITVAVGDVVLTVDAVVSPYSLDYSPLTFVSSGTLMLDDVVLTDYAPQTIETAPVASDKLTGSLSVLQEAVNTADDTSIAQVILDYGFATDAAARVRVDIFSTGYDANSTVQEAVIAAGGEVVYVDDIIVNAYVPPQALLSIALRSDVQMLRQWIGASSTDISPAPSGAPTGTVVTEAFNVLGMQDWHAAGFLGAGVRIGVIDTGFGSGAAPLAPPKSGETACINSASVFNQSSSASHGRNVVEILCDLAPSASVFMYEADSYASLYTAINRARTVDNVNVLLITLDLGVAETLGDGVGRGGNDPYAELALAKQNGIVVFASAGNNGSPADIGTPERAPRYAAITSTGAAITVNLQISHGDVIRVNTSAGASVTGAVSLTAPGGAVGGSALFSDAGCASPNPCSRSISISAANGATVQVQVVPVLANPEPSQTAAVFISSILGGTIVNNAGTLARPADSPNVITVGSVCTDDGVGKNFTRLADSSVGPVYGAGGVPSALTFPMPATGYSRSVVKPDLVAPSVVSTSLFNSGGGTDFCDPTVSGLNDANKFGGSSAAAAHAAGMTAVLLSNTTTPGYNRFNRTLVAPEDVVENVRFHMQTRSADLPAASANGFDMLYGAGIATMGHPSFNLNHSTNPAAAPTDFTCTGGNTIYVGQGNRSSSNTGTLANPYFSIGLALRQAAANDCVVVNPGEYTTPIVATGVASNVRLISYEGASELPALGTIIRITGQQFHPSEPDYEVPGFSVTKRFQRHAGLYVINQATAFTVSGFSFVPAARLNSLNDGIRAPQAIVIDTSNDVRIVSNNIGSATVNGIAYQGWGSFNTVTSQWRGLEATPVTIILTSNGQIDQNRFINNKIDGNQFDYVAGAITAADSTVTIRRNEFIDNENLTFDAFDFSPIVLIERSTAAIVGNAFNRNAANSIIQIRTPNQNDTTFVTRITSNIFLDNIGYSAPTPDPTLPFGDIPGGLINLFYAPQIYVVNNTFVGNSFTHPSFGALATRGVPNENLLDGNPTSDTFQTFDFHNNLVHQNTFQNGLLRYTSSAIGAGSCAKNSTANSAVTFNWISNTTLAGGSCGTLVSAGANNNRLVGLVFSDFIGTSAGFSTTDWRFWGLAQNAKTLTNSIDNGGNISQFGIPMFDANNYAAPFNVDVFGRRRSNSSLGAPTSPNDTDIGAFEFTELSIDDFDCDGNGLRNVYAVTGLLEDQGIITIDLECDPPGPEGVTSFILGAAGAISLNVPNSGTFDIDGMNGPIEPISYSNVRNYSTRCGDEFEGTRGVIGLTTSSGVARLLYCPPEHFYNQGITDPDAKVEIYYNVFDDAGATVTGKIEVTINPVNDLPLTASIGDNIPEGDLVEVTMLANTSVTLPLRPYVVFGNFEWSEAENPEFNPINGAMADYPFTILNPIVDSDPRGVIDGTPTIVANQLLIAANSNRGTAVIRYTARDRNNNQTTNYVRIRVASVIPNEPGLYDDSSIYWRYDNAQPSPQVGTFRWQALANLTAINNTLHQSNGNGDRATFTMIGTGFVLYMRGTSGGAQYTITVNGVESGTWTYLPGTTATSNPPISTATIDLGTNAQDLTCFARTRNVVLTGNVLTRFLSNNTNVPYTVMCNSQTNQQMEVVITNGSSNGPTLAIDAFGLLDDTGASAGGPFGPGTYDFESQEMRGIFTGKANWLELRNNSLTSAIGYRAVDGAQDISFRVNGATGFAIGTVLLPAGAEFRLCVRNLSNNHDLCQLVDTSPLATTTPIAYNTTVPWYGLNPDVDYEVTVSNITRPPLPATLTAFGTLVFDGLVVYGPQNDANGILPNGTTENDQLPEFAYLGGIEDSWTHVFNNNSASNQSLSTSTATHAGRLIAFRIAADAEYFLYDYLNTNNLSRQLMFCVDRHVLTPTANDFGRCIVVDTRAGTYRQVLANGTLSPTNGTEVVGPSRNTLLIRDDLFVGGWASVDPTPGYHQVEVFSLVNEAFNFDRVTVYGSGVLPPGVHEDFAAAVRYYDNTNTLMVPGVFTPTPATLGLNYTAATTAANTFLITNGSTATRDSGASVMWTKQVGASVVFGVDGDGFIPRFRLDKDSDAVSICWLRTSGALPLPNVIRDTGTCTVFDNFSSSVQYNQLRPITGLDDTTGVADYYAVAITNLGDNLTPVKHPSSPYINMWFDGVTVTQSGWQSLTPLVTGTTFETNFTNHVNQNRLAYSPTVWSSLTGSAATYSGGAYDISRNIIGAGVTFRTNGADAIRFRRNLGAGQALLEFCAAPESNPNNRRCTVVNNAGSGVGNEITVLLNTTGSTAPHVVNINALTTGNFILDTITPVNNSVPLTAGLYDDNTLGISYLGGASVNLVPNGNMDSADLIGSIRTPSAWTPIGGLAATSFTNGSPVFDGAFAGAAVVTDDGQGFESQLINFVSGRSYIFTARVRIEGLAGTVDLNLLNSGNTPVAGFTTQTTSFITGSPYQVVYAVFTPGGNVSAKLRFTGDGLIPTTPTNLASRRFLVDSVGVYEVGAADWETVANAAALNRNVTRSIQPGAEARFAITGTGFRIGMILDTFAGKVEICYGINPTFAGATCIQHENERSAATARVSRTFVGLAQNTYYVRVRDVEDGRTVLTVGNPTRARAVAMGRVAIDYVEVFNDALPPLITTDISVNETFQIGGVNALQLLPSNGWRYQSAANLTAFSGNSNVVIADPNSGAVSSVIGGHAGVLRLNLSQGATVILLSDAPNANKADLLYCVDGFDGVITYNPLTRRHEISGSTKCQITPQFQTSNQASLRLNTATANSTLVFASLSPSPLLIDGYQVLIGTQLSAGYFETSLSEGGTCVGTLSNDGCVGSGSAIFNANTATNWFRQSNNAYSGGTTLVLASQEGSVGNATGTPVAGTASRLTFSIENATGFSMITTLSPLGGAFNVTAVGTNTYNFTGSTLSTATLNRASIPFTGLPLGNYTVTIENVDARNLYFDALEVYGELQNLGSIYDDSATGLDGSLLIKYGPSINTWTRVEGASAASSLNRTFHAATVAGAVAMFEVGETTPATGITLFTSSPTAATAALICWKNLNTPASAQECSPTLNLAVNPTPGRINQMFPVAGRYAVSIYNTLSQRIQIDAVQVMEAGGLSEGIYTVQDLRNNNGNNTNAFSGTWTFNNVTNATIATRPAPGSTFSFQMKGVGFSILLNETTSTASPYTLCITRTVACDILNETINRIPAPSASSPFALTIAGLHNASGADEIYTVTLSSTDTRNLVVSGLHILGAKSSAFRLTSAEPRAEDTDVRLRTLPFGWTVMTVNKTGNVSSDSQAIGTRRGGIFYFEFEGAFPAIEYVRQIATTNSDVDVCFGPISANKSALWANHTTNCTTLNNKEANAFGRASIATTAEVCTTGCWAFIRTREDRAAALDLVRLVSPEEPLQAGLYEENFPGLRHFTPALALSTNAEDLLGLNIQPRVVSSGASGTFVRRYTAASTIAGTTTLNGGVFFTMEGTGFSVGFVTDTFQDEVRICYQRYVVTVPSVSSVLNSGRCQTYDNQSSAVAFRVNRTILGLPRGTYAVAVQQLDDNGIPALHTAAQLPLRMDIDTVTVYGDEWFGVSQPNWFNTSATTPITPALGRIETNVNTSATVNTVQYYGTWSNVANNSYGGGRYDLTTRAGSGVLFRTADANAITLYTALGSAFTEVFICATPLNVNPLTETGETTCIEQTLTGSGFQRPINFTLGDTVDEYVVSITTKRNVAFHLDAIQVFNSTVALSPGFYESDDARVRYNRTYTNFVPNGDFEVINPQRQPLSWTTLGAPATYTTVNSTLISGTKYVSFTGGFNAGIKSDTFEVPTDGTYPVAAYVLVTRGTAQIRLRENGIPIRTIALTRPGNVWQVYREEVELLAGSEYEIEIVATSLNSAIAVDAVQVNRGGLWRTEFNNAYSGGSMRRSMTAGASVTFNFTGTGFALGMVIDRNGGATEVCYGVGTLPTDATNCFVYQNEFASVNAKTSRVVAGLPQNTYVVRVREVDTGYSTLVVNNPLALRPNANAVSRVALDSIEIFGATTLPALPPGTYNENATNVSGVPYLNYFPANRFREFSGNAAAAFTNSSYVAVVENNGTVSTTFAGPSVVFNIAKQAGRSGTIVFALGPANNARSLQVLICAGNNINGAITWNGSVFAMANAGTPGSCTIRTTARTDRELIVNASDLAALGTTSSGTVRVSIAALVPGRFEIDGITYTQGDALPVGLNDDSYAAPLTNNILAQNAALLKFAVANNFGVNRDTRNFSASVPTGCNALQQWCLLRNNAYFGTTAAYTRANGATLNFTFEGSGFGLMVQPEAASGDIRICYKRTNNQTDFPAIGQETDVEDVLLNRNDVDGIYCEVRRVSTPTTGILAWQAINRNLINPNASQRYTFAYYGLPQARYSVEVRTILPNNAVNRIVIDAVNVFRNPATLPALQPGLHDDTVTSFSYEPSIAWTRTTTPAQPPAGAYNRSENITRLAGSIAQLRVTGNAVTFFQSLTGGSSRHVNLCLIVTSAGTYAGNVHCGETSQTAERPSVQLARWAQTGSGRMSPVMIYGLGEGTHTLIIENRDHNRPLSIDAIAVQP